MFCSYCCQFEMKCVEFILTETVTRSAQQWNIYELTTQQIWTTLKTTEFVIRFLAVLHFTVCHTSLDLRVMKGRNKVDNSVQDQQSDRLLVIYLSSMTCVATKWLLFNSRLSVYVTRFSSSDTCLFFTRTQNTLHLNVIVILIWSWLRFYFVLFFYLFLVLV